jgi:flagellar biosynthesis component FlhA
MKEQEKGLLIITAILSFIAAAISFNMSMVIGSPIVPILFLVGAIIAGVLLKQDFDKEKQLIAEKKAQEIKAEQELSKRKEEEKQAIIDKAALKKINGYIAALNMYVMRLGPDKDNTAILTTLHDTISQINQDEDITPAILRRIEIQKEGAAILDQLSQLNMKEEQVFKRLENLFVGESYA